MLGGRMSLIHEYGENKYKEGKDEGISEGKYSLLRQLLIKVRELKHDIKEQKIKPEEIAL